MRALLVDDERLARAELRRLLAAHPQVEIVGEASTRAEAVERTRTLRPAVVFLDIELPDGSGFGVLEELGLGPRERPQVVFTTAYDHFALEAFEVDAVDYLLKPIESERLAGALDRLAARTRPSGSTTESAQPDTTAQARRLGPADRVLVQDGDVCRLVTVAEIVLLEADDGGTRVVLRRAQGRAPDRPLRAPRSLAAIEQRLDPALFVRANRRQVIHTRWVADLDADADGAATVRLEDGTLVRLSRRRALAFRRRLEL